MDNFGFIEYRPLSCKLATYAEQKIRLTFPRGEGARGQVLPPLSMPAGAHVYTNRIELYIICIRQARSQRGCPFHFEQITC